MTSIDRIGEREMRATTVITGRVSDRWLGALNDIDVDELRGLAANVGLDENLRKLFTLLEDDRSSLMAATAELRQDQLGLALHSRRLRQYALLLDRVEQLLASSGAIDRDIQLATSQRRRDLLEQAANAANAHAALRSMTVANDEVIRALRAAGNAALLALRNGPVHRVQLLGQIDEIEKQRKRALVEAT